MYARKHLLVLAASLALAACNNDDMSHDHDHGHMSHGEAPADHKDHMDHMTAHRMAFNTDFRMIEVLFQGWTAMNEWQYALTLIFMLVFAIFGESITHVSRKYDQIVITVVSGDDKAGPTPVTMNQRLVRSLLYGVRTTIHFLLMLAAMTFDVGIFVMIMVGFTIGFFVFSSQKVGGNGSGHAGHH